jgi:hypothetical protein
MQNKTTSKDHASGFRAGCLLFSLGFLIFGLFFIWAYFSDASSVRASGNPILRLIYGSVFSLIGFMGLVGLILTFFKRRK